MHTCFPCFLHSKNTNPDVWHYTLQSMWQDNLWKNIAGFLFTAYKWMVSLFILGVEVHMTFWLKNGFDYYLYTFWKSLAMHLSKYIIWFFFKKKLHQFQLQSITSWHVKEINWKFTNTEDFYYDPVSLPTFFVPILHTHILLFISRISLYLLLICSTLIFP